MTTLVRWLVVLGVAALIGTSVAWLTLGLG